MHADDCEIRAKILELVAVRGAGKSICPSEVARALSPDAWRPAMPQVRAVAQQLVEEGLICAMQRGQAVAPRDAHGPLRLTLKME